MTPTSLVHIGDFHAGPGPRNADRFRALEQIIAEGSQLPNLGAWLWPGDLFHARSTDSDVNAIDERLQAMSKIAPVLIVYGNHDQSGSLDSFGRISGGHPIYVYQRPGCLRLQLATGQWATVFMLPYPDKARLVAAGVSKTDVVGVAADLMEPIFMAAAAELEQARANGDLTFMIGHINVAGSKTSVGQPNIGKEIELNPRHLDRLGDIPKLLNHIHAGQEIAGAHYAGSVYRQNWGEIEEKVFLVVTFDEEETSIERRRIDVPPMWHVEGNLTREGFTWTAKAGEGGAVLDPPTSWKGCEVRVRCRFKASERSVLNEQLAAAPFVDALKFKLEPVAVPDRDVRAPDIAAARTVPDKVAAFTKVATLPDSLAEKIAALEHADPAQLLADVDRQIAQLETREEESGGGMNVAHTSGEWTVEPISAERRADVGLPDDARFWISGGLIDEVLATVHAPVNDGSDVANAYVMAAAPDLLEVARIEHALQMGGYTRATAKRLGSEAEDAIVAHGVPGLNDWRRRKREAAIAKAEGKVAV